MYFSRDEIKRELLDRQTEGDFSEDNVSQWADEFVPVYYHEILKDWAEMPNEFTDSWQDTYSPVLGDTGIFRLMAIDLNNYYYAETFSVYNEIVNEAGDE